MSANNDERQTGAIDQEALEKVTRARLTQIMNLLCPAPDLQEAVLWLAPPDLGRDAVTEKQLRPIAATADWRRQRRMWKNL